LFFEEDGTFINDSTFNDYNFKKHMNLLQSNGIEVNEYDLEDKKAHFFPPLH
jgi:hypothetical protein